MINFFENYISNLSLNWIGTLVLSAAYSLLIFLFYRIYTNYVEHSDREVDDRKKFIIITIVSANVYYLYWFIYTTAVGDVYSHTGGGIDILMTIILSCNIILTILFFTYGIISNINTKSSIGSKVISLCNLFIHVVWLFKFVEISNIICC